MNTYYIIHKVMRGCMSAQAAYELVKAHADIPFFVTSGELEEFRAAAIRDAAEEARKVTRRK